MKLLQAGAGIASVALALIVGVVVAPTAVSADSGDIGVLSGHEIVSVDADAQGKCLDVYDWGRGPWIQMWACHNGLNQDWRMNVIKSDGSGTIVSFSSYASGKCIDTYPGRGNQLFQFDCRANDQDQWLRLRVLGDGVWAFESVNHVGQCLDIRDWGRGTEVQLWDCHYGTNQQWIMYTTV